jgi:CheY-like chemotaxis protein
MTALRILLAEDEALLRELTSEDLRDAGHSVACAEDGDMALKVLEQESFDLLLTDIRMPGTLDGWELARTARARWPGIKVVYLSGYSPEVQQPVAGGRFLKKPCRLDELLRVLDELAAG